MRRVMWVMLFALACAPTVSEPGLGGWDPDDPPGDPGPEPGEDVGDAGGDDPDGSDPGPRVVEVEAVSVFTNFILDDGQVLPTSVGIPARRLAPPTVSASLISVGDGATILEITAQARDLQPTRAAVRPWRVGGRLQFAEGVDPTLRWDVQITLDTSALLDVGKGPQTSTQIRDEIDLGAFVSPDGEGELVGWVEVFGRAYREADAVAREVDERGLVVVDGMRAIDLEPQSRGDELRRGKYLIYEYASLR